MVANITFIISIVTILINIRTFYTLYQANKRLDAYIKRLDELDGCK